MLSRRTGELAGFNLRLSALICSGSNQLLMDVQAARVLELIECCETRGISLVDGLSGAIYWRRWEARDVATNHSFNFIEII